MFINPTLPRLKCWVHPNLCWWGVGHMEGPHKSSSIGISPELKTFQEGHIRQSASLQISRNFGVIAKGKSGWNPPKTRNLEPHPLPKAAEPLPSWSFPPQSPATWCKISSPPLGSSTKPWFAIALRRSEGRSYLIQKRREVLKDKTAPWFRNVFASNLLIHGWWVSSTRRPKAINCRSFGTEVAKLHS